MPTSYPAGSALIEEISQSRSATPRLWWLGLRGFAVKYHSVVFYLDPYLSNWLAENASPADSRYHRAASAPVRGEEITNAHLVLATCGHPTSLDPGSLVAVLDASPQAKLVLPKSAVVKASSLGIPHHRLRTTDSGLRIEYFHDSEYIRVYAVPSSEGTLGWTPMGGYPNLGYLIRCGSCTIYHSGACVPYEGLAERLQPYRVTVALLSINGHGAGCLTPASFDADEAAELAQDIGARWLVPMGYGTFAGDRTSVDRFVDHMLGQRPTQRFKIFQSGEGWSVPED